MAIDSRSPRTLTASLNDQIREAGDRLRNRRRFVWVRGAALGRDLHQRIANPARLLWACGIGFLMGEFTRRPTPPPSQSTEGSPDAGRLFFETALNLIKLTNWARTLFTALCGAETPHYGLRSSPTCDPLPSSENAH